MHQKIQHEPVILRRPQVEQRTGLSRSTLYQYIKDGDFPKPVRHEQPPSHAGGTENWRDPASR